MASTIPSRGGTQHLIEFRRNDQDRRPPSRVLTPNLMGDPDPDRLAKGEARRLDLQSLAERTRAESRHYRPKERASVKRGPRLADGDGADG